MASEWLGPPSLAGTLRLDYHLDHHSGLFGAVHLRSLPFRMPLDLRRRTSADSSEPAAYGWGSRGRRFTSCQPDSGKPQLRAMSGEIRNGPCPLCRASARAPAAGPHAGHGMDGESFVDAAGSASHVRTSVRARARPGGSAVRPCRSSAGGGLGSPATTTFPPCRTVALRGTTRCSPWTG